MNRLIGSQTSESLERNFDKYATSPRNRFIALTFTGRDMFAMAVTLSGSGESPFAFRTCNVFDYLLTKLTFLGIEFQVSSSYSLEETNKYLVRVLNSFFFSFSSPVNYNVIDKGLNTI